MPKSKKKKLKHQDFQKVKLKVGKKLPRGQNETVATFQSRAIHIREQLHKDTSQPTTKRKLNITDLFSQCQHYSISVRHEALSGLRELLSSNPNLTKQHLSAILERVSELLLDKDAAVRQAVVKLLKIILPTVTTTEIAPFFPVISAHLCCAMTHIDDDIQIDSLLALDLCLENHPTLVTCAESQILPNFIELISRQSQISKSAGRSAGENQSRSLLVNPGSRLSSQKWRQKVLERVEKFLNALNSQKVTSPSELSSESPCVVFRNGQCTHHLPLKTSGENSTCLGRGFTLRQVRTGGGSSTPSSGENSNSQLHYFLQSLIPLLLQIWVEVGPAQLSSDLPGNALSPESMSTLASVVSILQLLLQLVSGMSENTGQLSLSWVRERYQREVFHHLLPPFPYCMHEKARSGKNKSNKLQSPQVSVQSLNLSVCLVMTYFDATLDQISEYIVHILNNTKLTVEQLQCAVKILERLVERQSGQVGNLLGSAFKLYQSRGPQAADKWILLNFFADLSLHCQIQAVISSSSLSAWLGSLPRLLVQCANGPEDRVERLLHIMQKGTTQNKARLLRGLQKEVTNILDPSKKVIKGWKTSIQKQFFELFLWLPSVNKCLLMAVAQLCLSGDIYPETVKYLLQILMYRCQQHIDHKEIQPNSDFIDFLSFLLSLLIGCSREQLEKINLKDDSPHVSSGTQNKQFCILEDFQQWEDRIQVSKSACEVCSLLQEDNQIHHIISSHMVSLLEGYHTLPWSTVCSILQWMLSTSANRSDHDLNLVQMVASVLLPWTDKLVVQADVVGSSDSNHLAEEAVAWHWNLFSDVMHSWEGVADRVVKEIFEKIGLQGTEMFHSELVVLHKVLQIHFEKGACLSPNILQILSPSLHDIEVKFPEIVKDQLWTSIKYWSSFNKKLK